ncbi:MAG TPA: protein-disulfide reductase DsbD domain-containing protein, partial [Terriglobales bacterium]|nr:protein-disulfide reductase DsbD domain-containing protein [Terriglobales bacterium]
MKKLNLAYLVLVLFAGLAVAAAQQTDASSRTFVSFEPMSTVSVAKGKSTPVVFHFRVKSGYHINSNRPTAEELIPTVMHFSLPGDVVIGRVVYPPGQLTSFPFNPNEKLSVYSGDVLIKARVVAPESAATGKYTIHAELKYQACDNNACYPPKKLPLVFDVSVGQGGKRSGAKARPTKTSP